MLKKLDELNVNDLRKGIDPKKRALSKAVIGKGLQEISIDGVLKFHTNAVTTHGVAYWQQWIILLNWFDAIAQTDLSYIERANLAVTSGDILIRCDCPSFLYHGFAFILSNLDADANMYPDYDTNMGPETRFPKIRNPELKGVMCKHLIRTVADIMPFKISSVAKAMKEFVESGKISFSDKGTAYVTADGPPRGEKAVEKVAKPDPKDEPPKEPVKKPEPEEDPEQPDTSENTDEVKESRRLQEMAEPSQILKQSKYYHGTAGEEIAQSIWKTGLDTTIASRYSCYNKLSTPMEGAVYLTRNISVAVGYARDTAQERKTKEGYVFEFSGQDLMEVFPDEDEIGEIIIKSIFDSSDMEFDSLFEYLEITFGELLTNTDYKYVGVTEDDLESIQFNSVDETHDIKNDTILDFMFTNESEIRDIFEVQIIIGKLLYPHLTDDLILKFIQRANNVVCMNNIKPIKMWQGNIHNMAGIKTEEQLAQAFQLIASRHGVGESRLVEATGTQVHENAKYKDIPRDVFNQIVLCDPLTVQAEDNPEEQKYIGSYSKWLLNLYIKGNLPLEDLYKAEEYLEIFNTRKNLVPVEFRDVNKFKSLPDLFDVLQASGLYQKKTRSEIKREIRQGQDEISTFYEDDKWIVVIPQTKEASIVWGQNSQWCTAARGGRNYFEDYDSSGTLYIVIPKNSSSEVEDWINADTKFQIYIVMEDEALRDSSHEISDINNRSVTLSRVIGEVDSEAFTEKLTGELVNNNIGALVQLCADPKESKFVDALRKNKPAATQLIQQINNDLVNAIEYNSRRTNPQHYIIHGASVLDNGIKLILPITDALNLVQFPGSRADWDKESVENILNDMMGAFDTDSSETYKDIADSLTSENAELIKQILSKLVSVGSLDLENYDVETVEDLTDSDIQDMIDELSDEGDDEFRNAIRWAISDGYNVGAQDDFINTLKKTFSSPYSEMKDVDNVVIEISSDDLSGYLVLYNYLMENDDAIDLMEEMLEWEFVAPYYGFSGFSDEAFNSYLHELLSDYLASLDDKTVVESKLPIVEATTPQKTIKAYKLFRTLKTKPGEIYPLFIGKNIPTPMGQWIDAESIPTKEFAFRPGWHSGVLPIAPHLMRKDGTMPPDRVWAEVEVPADVDWQPIVDKMPSKDLRGQVPKGGYYRFKTPKLQGGSWIISGAIKVNKLLTQEEVDEILGSSPLTESCIVEMNAPKKTIKVSEYQGQHEAPYAESGSPLYDVTKNGIYPEDVYTHGMQYYRTGDRLDAEAFGLLCDYRGKPNRLITIYRAIPKDISNATIQEGDWVTPIRQYAVDHGKQNLSGNYRILKKLVRANEIFTDGNCWLEWGYIPQPFDMDAQREKVRRRHERKTETETPVNESTIPKNVVDAFNDLAQAQRGEPERAMINVQKILDGGLLSWVCEHVGDLTHRMSERVDWFKGHHGIVDDKVTKVLRSLTHPYGFEKEVNEQIRTTFQYNTEHGSTKFATIEEFRDAIDVALTRYAEAHAQLKVYNKAQELARDAAVAVGRKKFDVAIDNLRQLKSVLDKGSEAWKEFALAYPKDMLEESSPLTETKISGDWEQYQNELPLLKKGVDLLREIESIGGPDAKAYIVGGAIRDIITGEKAPDDIDIATNVPIEELEKHFETHDIGANKSFGIVVIDYQGEIFEVALFRQDGVYSNGRQPDTVEIIMDFEGDAARRDFTINAMGVDKDGNIYDYFDGQKDIQNKILRTVGNPHDRFGEDYLRMLRTVRFASRLGFEIDPDTLQAIQDTASNIQNISGERIMKELEKMADQEGPKFADALELLNQSGLLQIILPEIFELQGKDHDPEQHPEGDAYQHTLAALRQNPVKNAIINLAILFHDVGKMDTQEDGPDGKKHYYRHAERSGELVDVIADRLKVDNETRRALKFGALNHMKMHELLGMSNSKIVKLISDPNWDTLLAVAKADSAARGEELFDAGYWDEVEKKVADLKLRYEKDSSYDGIRKLINGELVMRLRPDVKPSPRLGRIITQTMDWILDNNIDVDTKFDEVEEYIRNLNESKSLKEATLDSLNREFSDIPEDVREFIISQDFTKGDREVGSLAKPLLQLYKKSPDKNLDKLPEVLGLYKKFYFKKELNKFKFPSINQYKSLSEFYSDVLEGVDPNPIIFDDGEWMVRELNSKNACVQYTPYRIYKWCTAHEGGTYYETTYNKEKGDLYLIYKNDKIHSQMFVDKAKSGVQWMLPGDKPIDDYDEYFKDSSLLKFFYDNKILLPFVGLKFKGRKFKYAIIDGVYHFDNLDLSDLKLKSLKEFQDAIGGSLYEVGGSFYCDYNQLTSLEGAPQEVGGSFYCHDNQLTSLEGAPQEVGGGFYCHYNQLTSLEGAPQEVGGDFWCYNNQLTSLQGAPQEVGGYFSCHNNQLTSLQGAPQEVGGNFYCDNNQLTSLQGAPQEVGGYFYCDHNQLTSLEGAPQEVGGGFYCVNNPNLSQAEINAYLKKIGK